MARLTSEDAVAQIGNRYDLVLIGSRRARELHHGWRPRMDVENSGKVVSALKEIEKGHIGREYLLKPPNVDRREKPDNDERTKAQS